MQERVFSIWEIKMKPQHVAFLNIFTQPGAAANQTQKWTSTKPPHPLSKQDLVLLHEHHDPAGSDHRPLLLRDMTIPPATNISINF